MKKKLITALSVLAIFTGITSCGISTSESKQTNAAVDEYLPDFFEFVRYDDDTNYGTFEIREYRDIETGVHYFLFWDKTGVNRGGGVGMSVCPRYNADGTLYVD